jgi:hypothetical protein
VNIHGYVRTTNDLDIWINVSPENAASGRMKDLADLENLPE